MKALFHRIIDNTPKFVRITALVLFSLLTLIGFFLSLVLIGKSFGYALMNFIYYLLLAAGSALVILYAWKLYNHIIMKHTYRKLDADFSNNGYCKEMADTLNAIVPVPPARERALRIFLLVMAENYAEAEKEIAHTDETQQDSRDFAMIMTSKIRLYMMTDRMEKAEKLFENHSGTLDFTYEMQADLLPEYTVYSDDAFEYYMLSAVYSLLKNRPDLDAEYRKRAAFQLSKRSPGESQFYTGLMELNKLYALGKSREAYDLSQQLYMLTEQMQPPFVQSQKDEMRRALEQAKIYAAHTAMIEESQLSERKLPTEIPAGPTPEEAGFTAL